MNGLRWLSASWLFGRRWEEIGWLQLQPAMDVADFSSLYQSARTTIH